MGLFSKNKEVEKLQNDLDVMQGVVKGLTEDLHYFDGEKNAGELGRPDVVLPNYYAAAERVWEAQLTNGFSKLIADKWTKWTVGKGFRFNATPVVSGDKQKLIDNIEYLMRNTMNSRYSDYSEVRNVHELSSIACLNAFVEGDILAIYRVYDGRVTIQLVAGSVVGGIADGYTKPINSIISDGVEIDGKGREVAYHVVTDSGKVIRVKAFSPKTGLRKAKLVRWREYRLGTYRGVAGTLHDIEKLSKLERYEEATVKGAEISSNLVFKVTHGVASDGADPFAGTTDPSAEKEVRSFCKKTETSTGGTALNLPVDSDIDLMKQNAENNYPDFVSSASKRITAAEGLPYEVAMSSYDSNYSASRAAIKDWEYNLKVARNNFTTQFLRPFYELCLFTWAIESKIKMPEIIDAVMDKDYIIQEALFTCEFVGASIQSIDPLKEVKAVRLALADETTPLVTLEEATKQISDSDYTEVQRAIKKEKQIAYKDENTSN